MLLYGVINVYLADKDNIILLLLSLCVRYIYYCKLCLSSYVGIKLFKCNLLHEI